jgi:cyclopropane fatty-acyl-phospholipid synthase-like methyltransferase
MKVITNHPIAINSPDYLYPWGTMRDNSTNLNFINEVESYFQNKRLSILDIGCSGGQMSVDFHNRGHVSVGIEGSDYSVIHSRANWPEYHNKVLFTCDAEKPYTITDDNNKKIIFDCITSWECIEHISPDSHDQFFTNVVNHMHSDSIFVGSISTMYDNISVTNEMGNPVELHQSVFSKETWIDKILPKYFTVNEYPFNSAVRGRVGLYGKEGEYSFHVLLMKK